MAVGIIFWLIAFFFVIAVLVLLGFQLMSLADLENDFINPYECASQINKVILPEFAMEGILSLLFLLSGNWQMFLFSALSLYYNARLYRRRQHLIDVTEVYNLLDREKKWRLYKLVYLVIYLVLTLLGMILSVAQDD